MIVIVARSGISIAVSCKALKRNQDGGQVEVTWDNVGLSKQSLILTRTSKLENRALWT